jgi:RES domain-containing protein
LHLVKEKYKDQALTGMGASFLDGARWNEPGQRAVYSAENRALAVVESLAHVPRLTGLPPHLMCEVDVEDAVIEIPTDAPSPTDAAAAVAYGSTWFQEQRSVALAVPSIIVPEEKNVVLNAGHPDFTAKVKLVAAVAYPIDARLSSLLGKS